jgi:cytochrome c553
VNNNIAVGLILLSLFAASNVFAKSDVSKAKPHSSKVLSAKAISAARALLSDAKALTDAAEAQAAIDAKVLSDAKAASDAKVALDAKAAIDAKAFLDAKALSNAKALSDLKALSGTTNANSVPAPELTRAEKAQARADLAKADAALTKYCLESVEDEHASDMVKAERDRACAAKAAKEAAESAADANSERAREARAQLYAEAEKARRVRDEIYAKASKLKAADEINVESPEGVIMRLGSGDPVLGKQKSQLCQGCHGLRGYSLVTVIPKLAGQYADYIAKELRNFEAGTRSNQIMSAMSLTVEDEDLADISAYFASQKKMSGGKLPENPIGKALYLNGDPARSILGCVNCHGSDGKGRRGWTSMFPVIGGQHSDYLRVQLNNFRNGFRTNSAVGIMNKMTELLTDEEIEALVEYLATR